MQMRMVINDQVQFPIFPRRRSSATRRRCWPNMRTRASVTIEPPIPIEDIVEKHLKLGIEFDDMHRLFGVPRSGRGPIPISSAPSSSMIGAS